MYVIGTAGHVDHGKSLLVEALTGIDPDRLLEEKTRGMTIDLGFAWLTLPSGRTVSIIDVPGHERFIRNMLAGAGGVDLALLVVAADDGVMPQTREHLAILDLLGVAHGVVALTKRDLVDEPWAVLVTADISETLRGTTLEGAPIVECSARTGAGLDDVRRVLDDAISDLPPKRDIGRPRLPIDRVFTIGGFGTVVTGTLIDGAFALAEEVEALPGRGRGRIRGLQTHKDKVERAMPGTRTAINLAGIARDELRRGTVLARPGTLTTTIVLDAHVRALRGIAHPLRHNVRLSFHCGSDEASAQLRLLDCDELCAGDEAWAQIKLGADVAVAKGDRFVLRTPDDTVAGGVIVDIAPKRHRRRHAPTLDALASKLHSDPQRDALEAIERKPMIDRRSLIASLPSLSDADAMLAALVGDGDVVAVGIGDATRYATPDFVSAARERINAALDAFHDKHPLRRGMALDDARAILRLDPQAAGVLLGAWEEVLVSGAIVARRGFAPSPSLAQEALIARAVSELRAAPFSQPNGLDPELLAYLVESGVVVDCGDGVVVGGAAFAAMRAQIRDYIEREGAISLGQARDLLGTNRRHAQALLEHLDRLRVTRRVGEQRILR